MARSAVAIAVLAGAVAAAAVLPAEAKSIAYVFSRFTHAAADTDVTVDCPQGLNLGQKEVYLNQLPAAERARLLAKENKNEFFQIIFNSTTNGPPYPKFSRCTEPTQFPDPGLLTVKGPVALGMDLDGGDTSDAAVPGTCRHANFAGPDGAKGIDNQHWRAVGCIRQYRIEQDVHKNAVSAIRNGEMAMVMEISGFEDLRNAADVEVGLYSSSDPVATDGAGNLVTGASLDMHPDKRFHNKLKGHIKDGVLTIDPTDVHLQLRMGPLDTEWWFRSTHLQVELKPDSARGMLAAYADVETLYRFTGTAPVDGAVVGGYTCAGIYNAYWRLADGYKDATTGLCTALSTAWHIEAVRGYLIHSEQLAEKQ